MEVAIRIPVLAVFTGLIIGGDFHHPDHRKRVCRLQPVALARDWLEAWRVVIASYAALFTGSLGDPVRIVNALRSGRCAGNPAGVQSLPRKPGRLHAVHLCRAGGGAGLPRRACSTSAPKARSSSGAIFAAFVGYSINGLPPIIHIPLALLAGAVGGGLWGFIPGWLKAKTGGHEVINTIMMNYIAFRLSDWLLSGPMKRPDSFNPISPTIETSAMLPQFLRRPDPLPPGLFHRPGGGLAGVLVPVQDHLGL